MTNKEGWRGEFWGNGTKVKGERMIGGFGKSRFKCIGI